RLAHPAQRAQRLHGRRTDPHHGAARRFARGVPYRATANVGDHEHVRALGLVRVWKYMPAAGGPPAFLFVESNPWIRTGRRSRSHPLFPSSLMILRSLLASFIVTFSTVAASPGSLRVSPDGRTFTAADGQPCLCIRDPECAPF